MAHAFDSFGRTMLGLEDGLHVEHIATFNLATCSINDSTAAVLADKDFADFDHIPVLDTANLVVGVLNRTSHSGFGNASETMQKLDESLLVPAEAALMSYIRVAGIAPFKLVLSENGIKGIVTLSDLLKLPVRLLAFAFITHLETQMADMIRTKYRRPEESWLVLLSPGRQEKIAEKRQKLKGSRMELDLLEITDFCDKRQIVGKMPGFGRDFVEDIEELEKLRNPLMHAATFICNNEDARQFALKIEKAEVWIAKLQELIQRDS